MAKKVGSGIIDIALVDKWVILGGLITSTLCEFLIHPGLFWRFSGKDIARLTRESEPTI